ncbi:hypothetical protein BDQ94DRAFT_30572 [Aspergillus welwitschiae]|uniref:Uncharacterized protein n=1 Tax=Aspergillus welwitschiae TaxID=1341132 RepID=A0A3F3Q335_9EURO|nr:hypothetical protein BDQ94DRAFT_30572 [Aspergillus welwitschiae]RDH33531.1 hypothetical protein BDQ94DRAFT_30572 [Aspergillus welwitschiae]
MSLILIQTEERGLAFHLLSSLPVRLDMLRTYASLYLYSIMALDGGKSLIGFTKKK